MNCWRGMDALGTSSKETTTRMPEKIEVLYYVDEKLEAVSRRTAEYTVERILAATTARGKARIAISGGHTPKHTFELLADTSAPYRAQIPWGKKDQTLLREVLIAADHTSYHTGALVYLRKQLGAWNG